MRSRFWFVVVLLGLAGAACGGDDAGAATQSRDEWAAGYCSVFDHYFSATEQQVAQLTLTSGPIADRLADGVALAEGQVALLSEAAEALAELIPPRGEVSAFQVEVSGALKVDAQRMQLFVDAPPRTLDDLNRLLDVGASLGDSAIEAMRSSEHLSGEEFFALVDDPACARWS